MNDDDIDESLKENWAEILNPYNDKLISQQINRFADLKQLSNAEHILKYRGKFYFVIGEYELALSDLKRLLEFEANNTFALRYRGETFYIMEKYEESLADLNKLLEIKANDTWTINAREEVTIMYKMYEYNSLFILII